MALVDGLISELNKRGLTIHPDESDPTKLIIRGPAHERTAEVMAALKKFKAELLRVYGKKPEVVPEAKPEPE